VSIWLHVASGSLNETDTTRGIGHFLEHMAFTAPPTSRRARRALLPVPRPGVRGVTRTRSTGFDQTTYQITLPGGSRACSRRNALHVVTSRGASPSATPEIDSERPDHPRRKTRARGARQRVQDQVSERLAPESTLGRRAAHTGPRRRSSRDAPGLRGLLLALVRAEQHDHDRVGDTDPAMVLDVITKTWRRSHGSPTGARDVGGQAHGGARAIVATDPS